MPPTSKQTSAPAHVPIPLLCVWVQDGRADISITHADGAVDELARLDVEGASRLDVLDIAMRLARIKALASSNGHVRPYREPEPPAPAARRPAAPAAPARRRASAGAPGRDLGRGSVSYKQAMADARAAVLSALQSRPDGATSLELAATLGYGGQALGGRLAGMEKGGRLRRVGDRWYAATDPASDASDALDA